MYMHIAQLMMNTEEHEHEVVVCLQKRERKNSLTMKHMMHLIDIGRQYIKPEGDSIYHAYLDFILSHFSWTAPEALVGKMQDFMEMYPHISTCISAELMFEVDYLNRYGTNASRVREFTEGAFGPRPDRPRDPLTRAQAEFITSMVISEMVELMQTVVEPWENVIDVVRGLCDRDYNVEYVRPSDPISLIAEQADAMTDASYYMYDMGSRMGVNLDRTFNVVHAANMAKRDPETGEFRKREDGKILKPEGWKEPDVRAEIDTQIRNGAWNL